MHKQPLAQPLCSEMPGVESSVSAACPCRLAPRTRESRRQSGPAAVLQRLRGSLARSPAGGDGTAARSPCSEQSQCRPRVPHRLALLSGLRRVIWRSLGVSVPSWVQVSAKWCPLRQGCCAEVSAHSQCGWSSGRVLPGEKRSWSTAVSGRRVCVLFKLPPSRGVLGAFPEGRPGLGGVVLCRSSGSHSERVGIPG